MRGVAWLVPAQNVTKIARGKGAECYKNSTGEGRGRTGGQRERETRQRVALGTVKHLEVTNKGLERGFKKGWGKGVEEEGR